jgi:hypothetical protein
MKLYELTEEYLAILEALEAAETPEEYEEAMAALVEISDATHDKLQAVAKIRAGLVAEAEALKAEEQRLASRRKPKEAAAERLKKYAEFEMLKAGITRSEGVFVLAIQKNAPSVNVTDEDAIPRAYFTMPAPVLDRRLLLDELKSGLTIPGAEIQQTQSIRIK